MISPKITLLKSPSTGNVEVVIHDTACALPGHLYLVPEGSLTLEDAAAPYRKEIALLKKRLEKANRAKRHILNNLRKES